MEEVQNPKIESEGVNSSQNQMQDEYSMVQQQIAMQQAQAQASHNYEPENPIDTAHLLIQDSETTKNLPERDKDIILSNFNDLDVFVVEEAFSLYDDITFMQKQQEIRCIMLEKEFGELANSRDTEIEQEIAKSVEGDTYSTFDRSGSLKKGLTKGFVKRASRGFERTKQVETITNYNVKNNDQSEQRPGFMQKVFGGFKK